MGCTLQWSLSGHQHVSTSYSQEYIKRQQKKISNGRSSQLNQYLSYKPHSNFNPTWTVLKILCVSFKWYFWQKWKISMLVLGLHSKDRKSTKDKGNISNPKVNRGCPTLTANTASQQTVFKFDLDPQYTIFHRGSTVLGVCYVDMLMYSDHLQNWLDLSRSLSILLILAAFRNRSDLRFPGIFWRMHRGMARNLACWCTTLRND